ncbi:phage tail protein I [Pseudomonas chlororaphis]|uniref:Tail formation-like protein n=1 Tax=Pseudomonas chlororaphis TaxID=587753 RepID=A0AAX3G555_9PSED|nr:phage tail protein I [Pseudomonas chlororaphis]AZC35914.1 Phage tail fiber [Pseudomonas chlororaphis subsp. piscium]AZC42459.1 Phage tail fiber [Pseudomonas chlororaphis subsp. piscium]WDG74382.1 phage tail protein I [Pseudomonas chlororaphis]WDH27982.1 phage tail protein I [Pseudomonas chlororaphis]WDH72902.1 phage tail protein I [Pseudomonas chlororaphis]
MKSLLPLNSTLLERGVEAATEEVTEIPLRTLYNADTCPVHLLPYLAWAWSVDRWDPSWAESVKRAAIKASYYIHAHKGTIGALRRVVEPLGYLIEIIEWFNAVPEGVPGTFALKVGVLETGITEEMYRELERLIDDAKPVSRQLTGLDIILESRIDAFVGVAIYDGDEIDVYPWSNPDIDMVIQGYSGVSVYTLDELDMYPYG